MRISSLMLEDLISQYPGVSEVAVIGIPDEKWGERPLALIVLQQESVGAVMEQHIQAHVRAWAERGVISKWAVLSEGDTPNPALFLARLADLARSNAFLWAETGLQIQERSIRTIQVGQALSRSSAAPFCSLVPLRFHYASITLPAYLKRRGRGQPVAAGVLLKGEAACLSRRSPHQ